MLADILIVEDEKNISNLIEMALSRHGHKTDCVFDGESCADVLEKKHFDLILLYRTGFTGLTWGLTIT